MCAPLPMISDMCCVLLFNLFYFYLLSVYYNNLHDQEKKKKNIFWFNLSWSNFLNCWQVQGALQGIKLNPAGLQNEFFADWYCGY